MRIDIQYFLQSFIAGFCSRVCQRGGGQGSSQPTRRGASDDDDDDDEIKGFCGGVAPLAGLGQQGGASDDDDDDGIKGLRAHTNRVA